MARTSQNAAKGGLRPVPEAWDLLAAAARFTRQVDRTKLDAGFLSTIGELYDVRAVRLYQIIDGRPAMARRLMALLDGRIEHHASVTADNDEPLSCIAGCEQALAVQRGVVTAGADDAFTLSFPIYNPHRHAVRMLLIDGACPVLREQLRAIEALIALYQNHLNLIEDSELDSLTGLRNRRTFEHLLIHLLAGEEALQQSPAGFRRTHKEPATTGNWLAVLDIDRFKSINDRYGHLFGDEVLILVANLMHKSFRAHDPLFRFGGEEFVVMLCGVDQAGADAAVERFRCSLEAQTFPQVGRITISAGYTEIAEGELSSEVLNRADAALYYAKQNGRNRTCCYEKLVDDGLINPLKRSAAGAVELF